MSREQIAALAVQYGCTVTWFSCVCITYNGYKTLIGEAYNVERWTEEEWKSVFARAKGETR